MTLPVTKCCNSLILGTCPRNGASRPFVFAGKYTASGTTADAVFVATVICERDSSRPLRMRGCGAPSTKVTFRWTNLSKSQTQASRPTEDNFPLSKMIDDVTGTKTAPSVSANNFHVDEVGRKTPHRPEGRRGHEDALRQSRRRTRHLGTAAWIDIQPPVAARIAP